MWGSSYFVNPRVNKNRKEQPISYWTKQKIIDAITVNDSSLRKELAQKIKLPILQREFLLCINHVPPEQRHPDRKYIDLYVPQPMKFHTTSDERLKELSKEVLEKSSTEVYRANVEFVRWQDPGYTTISAHINEGELERHENVIVEKKGNFYTFKTDEGVVIARKRVDSWRTKVEKIE